MIWNPAFVHDEARTCHVHGWRRAFCIHMDFWRATPQQPGLMLALARGGSCRGVAYRLPDADPEAQMLRLLEREISGLEGARAIRWVTCRGDDGAFRALTFYTETSADFFLHLPMAEQVKRLARAAGKGGSNAAYLRNTVEHLEAMGLRDAYLWKLQRLVAEEIAAMPPLAAIVEPGQQ